MGNYDNTNLSNIGKNDGLFMALLLRAISVCVNDCCSIGLELIIILARALFTNDIDGRGGDGDAEVTIDGVISSNVTLDLCDLTT